MRLCLTVVLLFVAAVAAAAQDIHSWDSLGKLSRGDKVRVSLKGHDPVTGEFQSWTPEQVQAGGITSAR